MLSQTSECAIRAVFELARAEAGAWVGARTLARRLGISPTYLAKILQSLTREGVLESQRGKSGGFRLARPAGRVTLFQVVSPFEDLTATRRCLLGQPVCNDQAPCAAHHHWKQVGDRVAAFFRETTVGALL